MLTVMVDAHEKQDVGNADLAEAYLKATTDNFVVMKFTEQSVHSLCHMHPAHLDLIVLENGIRVLYVCLKRHSAGM
jgi:hypothetical protein